MEMASFIPFFPLIAKKRKTHTVLIFVLSASFLISIHWIKACGKEVEADQSQEHEAGKSLGKPNRGKAKRFEITLLVPSDAPDIALAAYKGDLDTLRRLVASGTSVEAAGTDTRTPLMLASAAGHIEAVKILLAAGAKVNARQSDGTTALHLAAQFDREDVVRLLLSNHANVNLRNESGVTALIYAASYGNKEIVQDLIAAGASPVFRDFAGKMAIDYAKANEHAEIVSMLERAPR